MAFVDRDKLVFYWTVRIIWMFGYMIHQWWIILSVRRMGTVRLKKSSHFLLIPTVLDFQKATMKNYGWVMSLCDQFQDIMTVDKSQHRERGQHGNSIDISTTLSLWKGAWPLNFWIQYKCRMRRKLLWKTLYVGDVWVESEINWTVSAMSH